jgi:hypothetical protein
MQDKRINDIYYIYIIYTYHFFKFEYYIEDTIIEDYQNKP